MASANHRTKSRSTRGQGSIYQRSDGGWTFTLQRRSVSARTKKELQPKIARLRAEVEAGVGGTKLSVGQWLDYWLDEVCPTRNTERTIYGYRGIVKNYLAPTIGARQLRSLQPEHVRPVYKAMAERGLSTATIRQCHRVLSRAMKVAVMEGKILRNPCSSIEPPRPTTEKKTHGTLTVPEVRTVLDHLEAKGTPRKRARWAVALLGGLRQGEALGLDWKYVDWDADLIRVREAQTLKDGAMGIGGLKSRRSVRDVPMMTGLRSPLRDLWEELGKPKHGLIFGPRQQSTDYWEWQRILEAAGLPRRSVHACRAAFASMLKEAGIPGRVVADLLGHEDEAVTNTHYIHTAATLLSASVDEGARLLARTDPLQTKPAT